MKKQTKALTRFRKRLASNGPGMTVAVIALVVALCGGAFAASNGSPLAGVSKAKRGPRGPKGATGPVGPTGPQGPAGLKGDAGAQGGKGEKGDEGKKGEEGKKGDKGESVVLTPIGAGTVRCLPQGDEGGVEVRLEGQAPETGEEICNGTKGEKGEKGEPWAPNNTLPLGATETGAWYVNGDTTTVYTPLSFTIPLAADIKKENFFYGQGAGIEVTETSPGVFEASTFEKHCDSALGSSHPTVVNSGDLCIYVNPTANVNASFVNVFKMNTSSKGTKTAGGLLAIELIGEGEAGGTWAVKG